MAINSIAYPRTNYVRYTYAHDLNNKGTFGIVSGLSAYMFHLMVPVSAQKVETETVMLLINFPEQTCPQLHPLCRIDQTFEN